MDALQAPCVHRVVAHGLTNDLRATESMDRETFARLVERVKDAQPDTFATLQELQLIDAPASHADIEQVEQALQAKLPLDYIWFLQQYGGGTFLYADVYSAQSHSDFYIVKNQLTFSYHAGHSFIAFSENGCGDYYGFQVQHGVCLPRVMFSDHETETIKPAAVETVLDYIAVLGLKAK